MPPYVDVALPIPGSAVFTYDAGGHDVAVGQQVLVPLARRKTSQRGFIVAVAAETSLARAKVKPIERVITAVPPITDEVMALCRWVADYYLCGIGEALAAAYPFSEGLAAKTVEAVEFAEPPPDLECTAKQARVLELLRAAPEETWTRARLARAAKVSAGLIAQMIKTGMLRARRVAVSREATTTGGLHAYERPQLNEHQAAALQTIGDALGAGQGGTLLLHGVTGSGKTEVYMGAIELALAAGKSALVLVPEIGLTPQALDRYRHRFGRRVAVLHSGLGDGERYDTWWRARRGEVAVMIGTRSAVFTPLPRLGLVIVDEEHDGSYKQDDPAPRYHGRDTAVMRANLAGVPAVLGSATPALESYYNAKRGKYTLLELPERASAQGLPPVVLVDHRGKSERERILTNELAAALTERLARGEQSILLLNRRGYALQVSCGACGYVVQCRQCSAPMAYHRTRDLLLCHHCDETQPAPTRCPACDDPFVRMKGYGTQQVVEAVQALLPTARVERMDSDAMRRRGAHDELLGALRSGDIDVLVGTQMVAKGLDVPNVTLVGVVNADAGMILPDFRAAERTFALLTQVAGRAGRGSAAGEVYIQTYCPDHYSVVHAIRHDYLGFYERETRFRRSVRFPPFSRLVLVRVESKQEERVEPAAIALYQALRRAAQTLELASIRFIGPTEAPLYQLQGWFRWQLALASHRPAELRRLLGDDTVRQTMDKLHARVKMIVDVDPDSLL